MRLVCPNCEAKYEVPEDAIPETGRDVQCANCGHSWYQMRPRAAGAEVTAAAAAPPAPAPSPPQRAEPVVEVAAVAEAPAPVAEPEPDVVEPVAYDPVVEATPVDDGVVAVDLGSAPPADILEETTDGLAKADAALAAAEPVVEEPADIIPAFETIRVATGFAEPASASPEALVEVASDVLSAQDMVGVDAAIVDAQMVSASDAPLGEAVVSDDLVITEASDDIATEADLTTAAAPVAAYAVDESVLAILREEADREAQARKAEAARPLETQTDLGIEAAIPAAKKVIEVISPAHEPEIDDKHAARRTRLPDVEEINSTLRPSETAQDGSGADGAMPMVEGRSSFRSGFLLVMTVAILGSALYGSADAIADVVPALAGPLKAYVSFVDSLRLQLDGLMQSATVAINGT